MSIRKDAYWTAVDTLITSGLAFALRVIVARMLAPEDFGIAMLAVTVVTVLQTINDFGLTSALIQRDEADVNRDFIDTTFTASMIMTVVLVAAMAGVAPLAAQFYGEPGLVPLIAVLGVTLLPSPVTTVAAALLYRQRDFKKVAIVKVSSNVIGLGTALILLLVYPSPWVIILQVVATSIASAIGLQLMSRYQYRLKLRRDYLAPIFSYSGKIFVNDLTVSLGANAGVFIVGRVVSVADAGLFALAIYLTDNLRRIVMSILNRVLFVHYSANKADLKLIADTYVSTVRVNCLLIFPAMTAFALFGPSVMIAILGEAWSAMAPVIVWLNVSVMIHAAGGTTSTLFKAIGRPGLDMMLFLSTTLLVLFPGMIAGAYLFGLVGVAMATALAKLISVTIRQIIVDRLTTRTTRRVLATIVVTVLKQAPIVAAWAIGRMVFPGSLIAHLVLLAIGLGIYAALEAPRMFPNELKKARQILGRRIGRVA